MLYDDIDKLLEERDAIIKERDKRNEDMIIASLITHCHMMDVSNTPLDMRINLIKTTFTVKLK